MIREAVNKVIFCKLLMFCFTTLFVMLVGVNWKIVLKIILVNITYMYS